MRIGLSRYPKAPTVDAAVEAGIMFAGTPDQVLKQFEKFYDHVGGFGHLLVAGQSGFLSHEETVHGIRMLAREVFPKLQGALSGHDDLRAVPRGGAGVVR